MSRGASHLVHEPAGMQTQAVEEHFLAEDVHLLDGDEQCGHGRADDPAVGRGECVLTSQDQRGS